MLASAPPCTREISEAALTRVVADAFPNSRICSLPFSLSGEMLEREMLAIARAQKKQETAGMTLLLTHTARAIVPNAPRKCAVPLIQQSGMASEQELTLETQAERPSPREITREPVRTSLHRPTMRPRSVLRNQAPVAGEKLLPVVLLQVHRKLPGRFGNALPRLIALGV